MTIVSGRPMKGADHAHLKLVERYYEETWVEYRCLWMSDTNRALHLGYWDDVATSHPESLDRMNEVMAERADMRPGARVLDAGCGVGATAMWLAERYGAAVHGVTIAGDQVSKAERYARDRELEHLVTFARADYLNTGLPDSSFEVVWVQESLCHAADHGRFLSEAFRLLQPGGRLVVSDIFLNREPRTKKERALTARIENGWVFKRSLRATELQRDITSSGFEGVRYYDVTKNVMPSMNRLVFLATLLSPIVKILEWRRIVSAAQRANIDATVALRSVLRRGLFSYSQVVARKPFASPAADVD